MRTVILFNFLCIPVLLTAQLKLGSWEIEEGKLVPNEQLDNQFGQTYWEKVRSTLPDELLTKYVVRFTLFTDGEQEDLGGMTPLNDMNDEWEIDLDTFDMNLSNNDSLHVLDYMHTLIHEFGHLITLNARQLISTEDKFQNDEMGYLTSEGYAPPQSYLGQFVENYWPMELLREWDKIDKLKWENKKVSLLFDFYLSRPQLFVSDYAAESPEEDIAESWTYFVFCDQPKDTQVKHKKISFFYQFPNLVKYREQIRSKLPIVPINYLESFSVKYEDD